MRKHGRRSVRSACEDAFFALEICSICGASCYSFNKDGADDYPVAHGECPFCKEDSLRQVGPPIRTLN